MIRGHVFVVNEETLPTHLSYQFVGVSSGEKDSNIGLLSDILRVNDDDYIFFYIEGRGTKKGRFFGIFKAVDKTVYHIPGSDAMTPNLPVKLIYRKQILPYRVYPKGVLEWVALDKLPTFAKELLWSLIYRKMKGGRGNTMLFPWETEKLVSLIQDENNGDSLTGNHFTFNLQNYQIESSNTSFTHNIGAQIQVALSDIRNSETHFQAYLLQNIGLHHNQFLPQIFGQNITWIGNEVFAGSGMQKIDILTIEKIDETNYVYRIIELKHPKSSTNIDFAPMQLEYYINWAREDIGGHIIGGRRFNLKPILLTLSKDLNSISPSTISQIQPLSAISNNPEIWEIDYQGNTNKVL